MSSIYPPSSTGAGSATAGSESVIDRHSHFDGLYRTESDLRIEGTAEGEIQCEGTVTVAEEASVTAKVRARNVTIAGTADGEIACQERITILPTGVVRGTLNASSLKVEEGAFFEGEFRMNTADELADSPLGSWSMSQDEDQSLRALDEEIGLAESDEDDEDDEDEELDDEDDEDDALDEVDLEDEDEEDEATLLEIAEEAD